MGVVFIFCVVLCLNTVDAVFARACLRFRFSARDCCGIYPTGSWDAHGTLFREPFPGIISGTLDADGCPWNCFWERGFSEFLFGPVSEGVFFGLGSNGLQ